MNPRLLLAAYRTYAGHTTESSRGPDALEAEFALAVVVFALFAGGFWGGVGGGFAGAGSTSGIHVGRVSASVRATQGQSPGENRMGYTTVTFPPSGLGNWRSLNPSTTHEATFSSGIGSTFFS